MPESPFDSLAAMYEEFSELPFRRHLEFPTVTGLIGPPRGLRILDLGCGSGVHCRHLAAHGADAVTGLDRSAGMIDHARRREEHERHGIRYLLGGLPPELEGTFDLVLSVYVLPYASTYPELLALCRTAADALRPGGRYVTLPVNPGFHPDPEHYARYGFRMYAEGPREDGAPVGLDLRFGSHDAHLTARYWSAPTLERALTGAGFGGHRWHPHRTSRQAAGDPFYQPYLDVPHAAVIETVKEAAHR
ncbi:class I SAM-dependent methyltransferase [Kitasatospora sp. NPDC001664]